MIDAKPGIPFEHAVVLPEGVNALVAMKLPSLAHLVLQKCKISAFTLWGCLGGCRGELN